MKDKSIYVIFLLQTAIVVTIMVGYVLNLYKLITGFTTLCDVGILEVLRMFGIVAFPLGGILGYF